MGQQAVELDIEKSASSSQHNRTWAELAYIWASLISIRDDHCRRLSNISAIRLITPYDPELSKEGKQSLQWALGNYYCCATVHTHKKKLQYDTF